MRFLTNLLFLCLISIIQNASGFEKYLYYNTHPKFSIAEGMNTTFLVSFNTYNNSRHEIVTLDRQGDSISYKVTSFIRDYTLIKSFDNGYLFFGQKNSSESAIYRTNSSLDTIKSARFPGNIAWNSDILELQDSTILFYTVNSTSTPYTQEFVLYHVDADFNIIWQNLPVYTSLPSSFAFGVKDNIVYTVVSTYGAANDSILLLRSQNLNSGNLIWEKQYLDTTLTNNLTRLYEPQTMSVNDSGIYILGDIKYTPNTPNPAYFQVKMMARFDFFGDSIWFKEYGTGSFSLSLSNNNGIACLSNVYYDSLTLTKFDSNGNLLWNTSYNDYRVFVPYCFISTSDGGFAFVCEARDSTSFFAFIVKTDSLGVSSQPTIVGSTSELNFNISYNQADKSINLINLEEVNINFSAYLYSIAGKLIGKYSLTNKTENLTLSNIASGEYIFIIFGDGNRKKSFKFIVL